ncbi:uncharacterized protein LOC116414669 [Apis florea]|uniref:uncharacterized protein LOC116414669 n=1 Tax=Apis florea TaxID=7463 RepID=UPI0012FE942C|nr:uncharacterized protein LOC116414669 [Apis florea]
MQETLHGLGPFVFCLGRITTLGVAEASTTHSIGWPSFTGVLSGSSNISCDTDVQPSAPSNLRYVATLLCRSSDETDCLSTSESSVVYSPLASQLSNGCNVDRPSWPRTLFNFSHSLILAYLAL